jgi:hypothetical protein
MRVSNVEYIKMSFVSSLKEGQARFEGIALTGDESGRDRRSRLYACPGDGTPAVQALNKFIPTRSLAPAGGRVDA